MSIRTVRAVMFLAVSGAVAALAACSSGDAPIFTATPEPQDRPTATAGPEGIPRDEAIQLAVEITRPLFDQLHSLGQYTTIVKAEQMTLGAFATMLGEPDRTGSDKQIWAIEIEIKLVGTPAGPEPTYSLVAIDAEDGGLELITSRQAPVLLGQSGF